MIGRRSHDDAQSFEEACNGGTPRDAHIAELIRVAEGLCAAAAEVEPSTQFRSSLRTRLMTEAATVLVPVAATARPTAEASPVRRPVRRRVATLTAAAVASAGAVGLVASSASAVPGEMLYPVKRAVETVELQLHRDDASRGSFQLEQATERLAEARELSADGRSAGLIADTLDDFSAAAVDGSDNLFSDFTARGQDTSIDEVNDFAATSSADLAALSAQLPDAAADSFAAATDAVTDLAVEASSLCGACISADIRVLADQAGQPPQRAAAKPGTDQESARAKGGDAAPGPADRPTSSPTPVTTASTPPTRPEPTTSPSRKPSVVPRPTPTVPKPPSLTELTDPLVGGLVGDEEQPGLVPGVLGGLLGTKP